MVDGDGESSCTAHSSSLETFYPTVMRQLLGHPSGKKSVVLKAGKAWEGFHEDGR